MKEYPERLKDVRYPKIIRYRTAIEIADRHFPADIWKCFFVLVMIVFLFVDSRNTPAGVYLFLLLIGLAFMWDTFSLDRVTIDFKSKVFKRTNINPLALLYRRFLQVPAKIYFSEIEDIFPGKRKMLRIDEMKYIVFIRTDAPYNLPIATFKNEYDCKLFAEYLKGQWRYFKRHSILNKN